jgi:DNA-binding transcriptional ArsR family regulator
MEDCCVAEMWKGADKFFIALGDENRQKILHLLGKGKRIRVNDIANESHLSRPAISHHLKVLKEAGILKCEKVGKEVYYYCNKDYILEMLEKVTRAIKECC